MKVFNKFSCPRPIVAITWNNITFLTLGQVIIHYRVRPAGSPCNGYYLPQGEEGNVTFFHKTGAPKLNKSSLLNRCYIRFWGCNPKYDLPVASIFPINIVSYFLNPGILFWICSDVSRVPGWSNF